MSAPQVCFQEFSQHKLYLTIVLPQLKKRGKKKFEKGIKEEQKKLCAFPTYKILFHEVLLRRWIILLY